MTNEKTKAILIVDDDANNVEILGLDLEDGGYEILTGCDGVEGWEVPENKDKKVLVHFERSDDDITLTITDDGDGFDWQHYMEIDPDRATHSHGRGIALSKMMSFDSIEYRGTGNEVVCKFNT